ncbi:MAG: hypothetical protein R3266_00630, partial [Gemmatimonadota bacterium]|nr:hypothetical protein [Gemmatimonadota bacterium]
MSAPSIRAPSRSPSPRSAPLVPAFLVAALVAPGCGGGSADFESPELDAALDELRSLAKQRSWGEGAALGELWAERAPASAEARAWHIYHLVRQGREAEAVEAADALHAEHPDDPWSSWALAQAVNIDEERSDEALELSERAWEARPDDLDFARMRADILRDRESPRAAIEFIESLPPELRSTATMLNRKGVAIQRGSYRDEELEMEDAYAAWAAAREADPTDVDAWFLAGGNLVGERRVEEAVPLLEKALELAPGSAEIHGYLWRAITGRADLTAEEKEARVRAGIEALLARDPDAPAALSAAARQYEQMGLLDDATSIEDRLLEVAPGSPEAEWVL